MIIILIKIYYFIIIHIDLTDNDKKDKHIQYKLENQCVCRAAFLLAYGISLRTLKRVLNQSKGNNNNSDIASGYYNDKSNVSEDIVKEIRKTFHKDKFLDIEDYSSMTLRNTYATKVCIGWMEIYFTTVGDHIPNRFV